MDTANLRARARQYLGPHFTPRRSWQQTDFPVFVRGSGCHLYDSEQRGYFDGLSGLYCANLGHGRSDIATAIGEQAKAMAYATNWSAAHPPAIEAATRIAELAPGDLQTTFFVNSGSEAVEAAVKFARQYHYTRGEPRRTKIIARDLAYHGTTLGALSVTGLDKIKAPFGPLLPGIGRVPNTVGHTGDCGDPAALDCVRAIEDRILEEGPDTVAAIIAEPVQNGRGALVPPDGYWAELRRIADRYGLLLVADEVICSFGRLGHWFGSDRFGVVPDLITFAKGVTAGYAPLGGLIVRKPLLEELSGDRRGGMFAHGATWGGHPIATAAAVATIDAIHKESILDGVRRNGPELRAGLAQLLAAHRCVKEIRGTGFFWAVELMADRLVGREFTEAESATVLGEVLPAAFARIGLILRGDDRGATMLMIAPPLIAGPSEIAELLHGVDGVLSDVESAIP